MTAPALAALEGLAVRLVQEAPTLDPAVVDALRAGLRADGRPLARAIVAVLEHVVAGTADLAIALPPVAMACATLADARLTEREREAARFEIETLLPVPAGSRPAPLTIVPDVPLVALTARRDPDR